MNKRINFDRETKDFEMTLDGEFIGYAATYAAAEKILDDLIADRLSHAAPTMGADEDAAVTQALDDLASTKTPKERASYEKAAERVSRGVLDTTTRNRDGSWNIPSYTSADTYTVNGQRCACHSGRHGRSCWHAALVEALELVQDRKADEDIIAAQRETLPYAVALAAIEECF